MRIKKTSSIGSAQKQLLKILKPNSNVQKLLLFLFLIIVVALGSAYYGALCKEIAQWVALDRRYIIV